MIIKPPPGQGRASGLAVPSDRFTPLDRHPCAGSTGSLASACFVGCLVVAVPQVAVDHDDAHWPVEAPAVELVRGGAPGEVISACGVPAVGCLAAPRDDLGCRAVAADEDPQPRITGFPCRRPRCLGGAAGRARGSSRFSSPSFLAQQGRADRPEHVMPRSRAEFSARPEAAQQPEPHQHAQPVPGGGEVAESRPPSVREDAGYTALDIGSVRQAPGSRRIWALASRACGPGWPTPTSADPGTMAATWAAGHQPARCLTTSAVRGRQTTTCMTAGQSLPVPHGSST
jgi:hypothetical protein